MTDEGRAQVIAVEGATLSRAGVPILRGVSLRVGEGESVAVLGPSGSGKSTLLRLIAGLAAPDGGQVTVGGVAATGAEARARVGFVMQEGALFPHLTLAGNVTLTGRLRGQERAAIEARLAEVCAIARVDPAWLGRYPAELSGGQRQRGGLARALFSDPAVLLFDEPLSALDPLVRAELQGELAGLPARLGKTAVFVTHDVIEATRLARRLVLLADGRLVAEGTIDELRAAPEGSFVRRFLEAQGAIGGGP
jgi:osmoprotectant transport system ATP-binding protein